MVRVRARQAWVEYNFDRGLAYDVRIIRVKDGDSVIVEVQDADAPTLWGYEFDIRLAGIDAPELDQPLGEQSKRLLEQLLKREVGLVVLGLDKYRRTLGVFLFHQSQGLPRADDSVNREMVRQGMAFWYQQFASYETVGLEAAEREAQRERRGVWRQFGGSTRPWDHRRAQRAPPSGCLSGIAALTVVGAAIAAPLSFML